MYRALDVLVMGMEAFLLPIRFVSTWQVERRP